MDIVFKASAIAVISAVCILLIKGKNPEISFVLTVLCVVIFSIASIKLLSSVIDFVNETVSASGLPAAIFSPIYKCTAIAIVTKLVVSLCKDAGQTAIASAAEYLGNIAAVLTVLPLLKTMLSTLQELV